MTDRLVLLSGGHMALVVPGAALARVDEEAGEGDIGVTATVPLHVVHEATEAHQGLLHLLVSVEPAFLARADIRHPAVRQLLRSVVETEVSATGQGMVVDR